MATVAEIEDALRNADAAGDEEAARQLADALVEMRGRGDARVEARPAPEPMSYDVQGLPEPPVSEAVAKRRAELRSRPRSEVLGRLNAAADRAESGGTQSLMAHVNQGVPFVGTFSDEFASGVDALAGYNPESGGYFEYPGLGKSYYGALGARREQLRGGREDMPYTSMAAELSGGLPFLTAGAASQLPKAVSQAPTAVSRIAQALTPQSGTALGNIGRGGAAAALPSYLYGAGAGEGGAENRLESGKNTAMIGALLGAGFTAGGEAAHGLGRMGGQLLNRMAGGTNQSEPHLRKLAKAILDKNPGMAPEIAMQQARMKLDELGPNAVAADINDETRLLAGTIYRQGDAPAAVIRNKVIPRQEGIRNPETEVLSGSQSGRIREHLDDIVPESTTATRAALRTSDDVESGFYDEAYAANQQMDSPELRRILKTPLVKEALDLISESFRNRGQNVSKVAPELTALVRELSDIGKMADPKTGAGIGRGLKLETLDLIKRTLDDIGKTGARSDKTAIVRKAGDAKLLARELRDELDRLDVTAQAGPKSLKAEGGAYARGRERAQKRIRARESLKDGESFLKKDTGHSPDELRAAWAGMSPEEQHAARISFVGALKNRAGNVKFNRDATRDLYGDENLEDKIRLLFGDDPSLFARYIRGLRNERELYKLYAEITGGSQTQQRQAAARALEGEPAGAAGVAMDLAVQAPTRPVSTALGAIPRGFRALRQWSSRMPEGQRLKLAEALMGRDLGALERQAKVLNISNESRRRMLRALAGANLATTPARGRLELDRPY